jgi:hypothetical protein
MVPVEPVVGAVVVDVDVVVGAVPVPALYRFSLLPPPQNSAALPLQGVLQSPAAAAAPPSVFPQ